MRNFDPQDPFKSPLLTLRRHKKQVKRKLSVWFDSLENWGENVFFLTKNYFLWITQTQAQSRKCRSSMTQHRDVTEPCPVNSVACVCMSAGMWGDVSLCVFLSLSLFFGLVASFRHLSHLFFLFSPFLFRLLSSLFIVRPEEGWRTQETSRRIHAHTFKRLVFRKKIP